MVDENNGELANHMMSMNRKKIVTLMLALVAWGCSSGDDAIGVIPIKAATAQEVAPPRTLILNAEIIQIISGKIYVLAQGAGGGAGEEYEGGGSSLTATVRYSEVGVGDWPRSSSSFTPADNSLLVVMIAGMGDFFADNDPPDGTVSGGGLTWTRQVRSQTADNYASFSEIWTAPVSTGASMTVTASIAGADMVDEQTSSLSVTQITGYDTGDPFGLEGSESTTQETPHSGVLNLSLGGTTAATSIVLGVLSADGDNGAGVIDGGSGWTEIVKGDNDLGWWRSTHIYKAGALTTADWGTWTSDWGHSASAIEIKAAP